MSPRNSSSASNSNAAKRPDLSNVWKMPLDYFDMHMMLSLSRQSLDPKLRLAMQMLKDNIKDNIKKQRLLYDSTDLIEMAFWDPGAQRPWKTISDEHQFEQNIDKHRAKLFNIKRADRIVKRDLFNALAEWILNNGIIKPGSSRRQEIALTYQMDTYALTVFLGFTRDKRGGEVVHIKELTRTDYETGDTTHHESATGKIVKEVEAQFDLPLRAWRHKLQKLMFT